MPLLTTLDRNLMAELADESLLLSPFNQYPDLEYLDKLVDEGWVAAVHYRQGEDLSADLGRRKGAGRAGSF